MKVNFEANGGCIISENVFHCMSLILAGTHDDNSVIRVLDDRVIILVLPRER